MERQRDREKRKIINDSDKEYVEEYKNRTIKIPARGFIVMNRREAVAFLGTYRFYDRETNHGTKPLRWEPFNNVEPTKEEETIAAKESADLTGETGRKIPMKEAEELLDSNAVVGG